MFKHCKQEGCESFTRGRSNYCMKHRMERKKLNMDYDRNRRNLEAKRFYNSRHWKYIKEVAKKRDDYLCVKCKEKGLETPMNVVDHIIEYKDDKSLALVLSNLMCLCHPCHNAKTSIEKAKRKAREEQKKGEGYENT